MNRLLASAGGALARYLAAPSHCARAVVPTDLDAMRRTIRAGDVLLVEGNSRFSSAIKYLTHSNWSHAALYVGEGAGGFIEADVVEGVRAVHPKAHSTCRAWLSRLRHTAPAAPLRAREETLR